MNDHVHLSNPFRFLLLQPVLRPTHQEARPARRRFVVVDLTLLVGWVFRVAHFHRGTHRVHHSSRTDSVHAFVHSTLGGKGLVVAIIQNERMEGETSASE